MDQICILERLLRGTEMEKGLKRQGRHTLIQASSTSRFIYFQSACAFWCITYSAEEHVLNARGVGEQRRVKLEGSLGQIMALCGHRSSLIMLSWKALCSLLGSSYFLLRAVLGNQKILNLNDTVAGKKGMRLKDLDYVCSLNNRKR